MPQDFHESTGPAPLEELKEHLDELWTRYLDLLDTYIRSRDSLRACLCNGFLSLAHANSRAPIGRRYGTDWYDERMKASTRIRYILHDSTLLSGGVDLHALTTMALKDPSTTSSGDGLDNIVGSVKSDIEMFGHPPSPPATPRRSESEEQPVRETGSESRSRETRSGCRDPLNWFGIFTSPSLRNAQASFSDAVRGSISQTLPDVETRPEPETSPLLESVNTAMEMRKVEAEIRRTRKVIARAKKETKPSSHE